MEKEKESSGQARKNLMEFDRDLVISCPCTQSLFTYVMTKYFTIVNDIKPQYHYTDINGFMSIMKNKELWATNTRFLNDETECLEGLLLAQEIIREYLETCIDKEKAFLYSFYKVAQDRIDKGSKQNVYSISFCEDGDLLSQWRGYGKRGGISIGFDLTYYETEHQGEKAIGIFNFMDRYHYETVIAEKREADDFLPADGEFWAKLRKVIYDKDEQRKILDDLIDIGIEAVRQGNIVRNEENLVNDIMYSLDYLLPTFKNKGFEEEKEIRYIWRDDGSRKIYFRERSELILPYIRCMIRDCNCQELKIFPVKDIIVGPQARQKEVIDGIKYFLQCNGYEYLIDKVRPSEIPYRE